MVGMFIKALLNAKHKKAQNEDQSGNSGQYKWKMWESTDTNSSGGNHIQPDLVVDYRHKSFADNGFCRRRPASFT
jgi:hypothetical protein